MSPKSVKRFWDNDMRAKKSFAVTGFPLPRAAGSVWVRHASGMTAHVPRGTGAGQIVQRSSLALERGRTAPEKRLGPRESEATQTITPERQRFRAVLRTDFCKPDGQLPGCFSLPGFSPRPQAGPNAGWRHQMEPYETDLSEHERLERRMRRRAQPYLRDAATEAGLFSGCRLSRCRRAKQCLGRHPDAEIGSSHYKKFPPCVTDDKLQNAFFNGMQRLADKVDKELLAEGHSPEAIEQMEDLEYEALYEADDWPEDPLARVTSPRNRGSGRKRRKTSGRAG
jgi:hypothetical protein